jgi:hypothetical protein
MVMSVAARRAPERSKTVSRASCRPREVPLRQPGWLRQEPRGFASPLRSGFALSEGDVYPVTAVIGIRATSWTDLGQVF